MQENQLGRALVLSFFSCSGVLFKELISSPMFLLQPRAFFLLRLCERIFFQGLESNETGTRNGIINE